MPGLRRPPDPLRLLDLRVHGSRLGLDDGALDDGALDDLGIPPLDDLGIPPLDGLGIPPLDDAALYDARLDDVHPLDGLRLVDDRAQDGLALDGSRLSIGERRRRGLLHRSNSLTRVDQMLDRNAPECTRVHLRPVAALTASPRVVAARSEVRADVDDGGDQRRVRRLLRERVVGEPRFLGGAARRRRFVLAGRS